MCSAGSKGQSSSEYLIALAVLIILTLSCVYFITQGFTSSPQSLYLGSKIYWLNEKPLAITDAKAIQNGLIIMVKNAGRQGLFLHSIYIRDRASNITNSTNFSTPIELLPGMSAKVTVPSSYVPVDPYISLDIRLDYSRSTGGGNSMDGREPLILPPPDVCNAAGEFCIDSSDCCGGVACRYGTCGGCGSETQQCSLSSDCCVSLTCFTDSLSNSTCQQPPDLVALSSPSSSGEPSVPLILRILNIGPGPSGPSTANISWRQPPCASQYCENESNASIGFLPSSQYSDFSTPFICVQASYAALLADSGGNISESSEINNFAEIPVPCISCRNATQYCSAWFSNETCCTGLTCEGESTPYARCCYAEGSGTCALNPECCFGLVCIGGICSQCLPEGQSCAATSECCSGLLCDTLNSGNCVSCLPKGGECSSGSDCCSGTCDTGLFPNSCSGKPDLTPSADLAALSSQHNVSIPFNVSISIKNEGDEPVPIQTLAQVQFRGANLTSYNTTAPLAPGATHYRNATLNCTSSGGFEFRVIADASSEADEWDEANNEWNYTVPCGSLPDLRSGVNMLQLLLPKQINVSSSQTIYTYNYGTNSSPPSHTHVFFNGALIANFSMPTMSYGTWLNSTSITCPDYGLYEFQTVADAQGEVFEQNESNNRWNATVHCGEVGDLAASASLESLSIPHLVGVPFIVTTYTKNLGNVIAYPTWTYAYQNDTLAANFSTGLIYPLMNKTQNVTLNCTAPGPALFTLLADAANSINESDETNNQWNYTAQCANESTYALAISANNTAPDVLDPVFFNYTLVPDAPVGSTIDFTWNLGPTNCYDGVLPDGTLNNGAGMDKNATPSIRFLCPTLPAYGGPAPVSLVLNIMLANGTIIPVVSNSLSIPVDFCSRAGCPYESYDDVLLVLNNASAESQQIGNYFAQARGVMHILNITNLTAIYMDVTEPYAESHIRQPIRDYLSSNNLTQKINYIVLTRGVPFRFHGCPVYDDYYSIDAHLVSISQNFCDNHLGPPTMPYYSGTYDAMPVFSSAKMGGTYLATRLNGYTVQNSTSMVDRAYGNKNNGIFVFDKSLWGGYINYPHNVRMDTAMSRLQAMGVDPSRFVVDTDGSIYIHNQPNVLMYISWGYNDAQSRSSMAEWYTYHAAPNNTWAPGGIGEYLYSYSSYFIDYSYDNYFTPNVRLSSNVTFPAGTLISWGSYRLPNGTYYPNGTLLAYETTMVNQTQFWNYSNPWGGYIGDMVAEGAAGAMGEVTEPNVHAPSYSDLLFPRYYQGYNLADAFYSSSNYARHMDIYQGDPKGRLRDE
jgi:uncharacterized protein (TIGR03790 family)